MKELREKGNISSAGAGSAREGRLPGVATLWFGASNR